MLPLGPTQKKKRQELKGKGYDAVRFEYNLSDERVHVWGRHPSDALGREREHKPYDPRA
jgi:hypothetical protein